MTQQQEQGGRERGGESLETRINGARDATQAKGTSFFLPFLFLLTIYFKLQNRATYNKDDTAPTPLPAQITGLTSVSRPNNCETGWRHTTSRRADAGEKRGATTMGGSRCSCISSPGVFFVSLLYLLLTSTVRQ